MRLGIAFIFIGIFVILRSSLGLENPVWNSVLSIAGGLVFILIAQPGKIVDGFGEWKLWLFLGGILFCIGVTGSIYQLLEQDVANLVVSSFSIFIGIVLIIRSLIISRRQRELSAEE